MARKDSTETTETTKVSRPRRSPAEKAEATLAQAQKRYDKAVAKRTKIAGTIDAAETEVQQAERFLQFAQGDPNLPPQSNVLVADQEQLPQPADEV